VLDADAIMRSTSCVQAPIPMTGMSTPARIAMMRSRIEMNGFLLLVESISASEMNNKRDAGASLVYITMPWSLFQIYRDTRHE
jgi:hypothetical protein